MPIHYPLFYIHSPNFGDAINPFLYGAITRTNPPEVSTYREAKILACGSIAHEAAPNDIIWGSGCNPELPLKTDESTRILALRGPLSAEMFYEHGHEDITDIYGDPALLLPRYFPPVSKNKKVGVIPHYTDRDLTYPYIDIMTKPPELFIKKVTECEMVVSSALHGIVVAEAYGIPAVWVEFSDNVAGHGFKFRDYYLGTNRLPPEPLNWRNGIHAADAFAAAKDWQPPEVDLDLLLSVCPFEYTYTDYWRWIHTQESWSERNQIIADMFDNGARVFEFGAGNQQIRKMLPSSCAYTPSDIYKRTPDTVVCDLNTGNYPDLSGYNTIVFSGVLEYITALDALIRHIAAFNNITTIICSYHTSDLWNVMEQTANGWNALYEYAMFVSLFKYLGAFDMLEEHEIKKETIFKFGRKFDE